MSTITRATPRTWWGLATLLLPALLVSMDISVLFVAAPAITEALEPSAGQWLWMMDVYGFVMAGLLITMGGLGDRIGRRRMLLMGAVLFGAASLLIAFSTTAETMILARALLGIGAATLAPSTLSLIRGMFTDQRQRRTAIAAWTIAFTGGAVAGPIFGGFLLAHFWWGSVFLINVPVMALLLITAPFLVPESRDPRPGGFDLPGAALSLAAVLSLVYGIKHLTQSGMDTVTAGTLIAGVILIGLFIRRQRRAAYPLVPLDLFARPAFAASVAANTVASFAAAGLGLLAFTYLQTVHDLTPLAAAVWTLPTFLGTFAGAAVAGLLADRIAPARLLPAGLLIAAVGFTMVAFNGELIPFVAGYGILTLGIGIVGTLSNSLVIGTAPPERVGAASGISETSVELGAALGIATLGTVSASVFTSAVPEFDTVMDAVARARGLDEPARSELLDRAFTAYESGLTAAALGGAAVLLVIAGFAGLALRRLAPSAAASHD
ncbi:DHA2 family multidrug resistance protein-like MFS transporter [Stackebrandtia endophytica]|uniref:DHA2 family multidrug resistance protein-like MFS transporter n=1 Tax=Stackebrandtia endophytica TaxID=1496996 RepID=A0A543AZ34_9ACTN|nr:MFS transporter [Stackebrandtia endophytica]TQL77839.1 DHA2 family multidrug resistance protein-like MFS transporter [Stackebrandtia endophytica]